MKYVVYRQSNDTGPFGDSLLAAMFAAILQDQGIDAVFWDKREWLRKLVDVKLWDGVEERTPWRFNYKPEDYWDGRSIMLKAMNNFCLWSGIKDLLLTRRLVPVKYCDEPGIQNTDVSICSATGEWTPYRNWPYFSELKSLLNSTGLTWVDVSTMRGNSCLNQVRKSRLYLGLETGLSHFVSSQTSAGLIIQSGYSNISYWSSYNYQVIKRDVPCKNCFLRKGCLHEHSCMREISPREVFSKINESLECR